jgi:hypothetical protein
MTCQGRKWQVHKGIYLSSVGALGSSQQIREGRLCLDPTRWSFEFADACAEGERKQERLTRQRPRDRTVHALLHV